MKLKNALVSSIISLPLLASGLCAQKSIYWGTARERGLRGPVRLVRETCIHGNEAPVANGFEFTRRGELLSFSSPPFIIPDCIIAAPQSRKVTKRNTQGDVEEASFSIEGDVIQKDRAEYVYDELGNWTRRKTSRLYTYSWEGGPPENTWQVMDVCTRDVQYYR